MLLDAALQLILGLAQGLLNALPQLISELPAIITGIVDFLINASPQLTIAGFQLLVALIANLPAIIVAVVRAVPQIVQGLLDSFNSYVKNFVDMGTNLIKGLWQGISDAGEWLWNKISGFFASVVDRIKDFFGIQSPSELFAGIGGNMAEGIGVGFEDTMAQVSRDMQNSIPTDFRMNYSGTGTPGNRGSSITQNISVVSPKPLSEKELARQLQNISRRLALEI